MFGWLLQIRHCWNRWEGNFCRFPQFCGREFQTYLKFRTTYLTQKGANLIQFWCQSPVCVCVCVCFVWCVGEIRATSCQNLQNIKPWGHFISQSRRLYSRWKPFKLKNEDNTFSKWRDMHFLKNLIRQFAVRNPITNITVLDSFLFRIIVCFQQSHLSLS